MRIVTSAPNKVILCGEHYVVYGAPALAIPTNNRNKVVVSSRSGDPKIIMNSNLGTATYYPDGRFEGNEAFKPFANTCKYVLSKNKLEETIDVTIIHSGAPKGMGASSSIGGALGLAMFKYFNQDLSDDDLFECAQSTDEIAHGGRPSGIDARTTTKGKPQRFKKSFNPPKFDFEDVDISFPVNTDLIIVDTYKRDRETTGGMMAKFAKANKIEKKPEELTEEEINNLFKDYLRVYNDFMKEMNPNGDAEILGEAFNKNNQILAASDVSTYEIEKVRDFALRNGAYGAKLTGGGGKGGAVIVLVDKENTKNIIDILNKAGYNAFSIEIAEKGAVVEMVI